MEAEGIGEHDPNEHKYLNTIRAQCFPSLIQQCTSFAWGPWKKGRVGNAHFTLSLCIHRHSRACISVLPTPNDPFIWSSEWVTFLPKGPNLNTINRNSQFREMLCHWCFPWKNKSGVRGPDAVLLTTAVYWAESEGSTQSFGPELCAELTTRAWPGASQGKGHRSFFPHHNDPNN